MFVSKLVIIASVITLVTAETICTVNMPQALAMAQASYDYSKTTYPNVVILDGRGIPVLRYHQDYAGPGTANVAGMKARTSHQFGMPTSALHGWGDLNYPGKPAYHLEFLAPEEPLIFITGGLPLYNSYNQLCGNDATHDEFVAKAGQNAFGATSDHFSADITRDPILVDSISRAEAAVLHAKNMTPAQAVGILILSSNSIMSYHVSMTGAPYAPFTAALAKSRATWMFNIKSGELQSHMQPGIAGAVPIRNQLNQTVGSISVSGCPTMEQDEEIAMAGVGVSPITIPKLKLTQALAAIDKAMSLHPGHPSLAVAIDMTGDIVAMMRHDAADIALKKARMSLGFMFNTTAPDVVRPISYMPYGLDWTNGGLVVYDGGMPLLHNNQFLGAIGVVCLAANHSLTNLMAESAYTEFMSGREVNLSDLKAPSMNFPKTGVSDLSLPIATLYEVVRTVKDHAVAVYDDSGYAKFIAVPDNVPRGAGYLAQAAARTSALLRRESNHYAAEANPSTGSYYTIQNSNNGLVLIPGGAPIIVSEPTAPNGITRGSVGVSSGLDAPNDDHILAKNIAANIAKKLGNMVAAPCKTCEDKKNVKWSTGSMWLSALAGMSVASVIAGVFIFAGKAKRDARPDDRAFAALPSA